MAGDLGAGRQGENFSQGQFHGMINQAVDLELIIGEALFEMRAIVLVPRADGAIGSEVSRDVCRGEFLGKGLAVDQGAMELSVQALCLE